MHTHPRDPRPLMLDFLLAIALFATILLSTQATAAAAEIGAASPANVTGQPGNLGVANAFVTSATEVNTPDGTLAGIEGVQQYRASLAARYPDAAFQVIDTHTVNSLIIVDWTATVDGTVVFPGRTLVRIEDGTIAEIHFLNLNGVSSVQGQAAPHPTSSAYTVSGPAPETFATDADQDPS